MVFPKVFDSLKQNVFSNKEYSIVPIRYEDRMLIMQWRNEQVYHLRQKNLLTEEDQENYYSNIVFQLFNEKAPSQLLFSYLEDGECIGYGGLVHIDRGEGKAEISFIMNTKLEERFFSKHWTNFLSLIEQLAFEELSLKAIFTYAYNLRPHLYPILEQNGFINIKRLKNEIKVEGKDVDVVIHEKKNPLQIRKVIAEDVDLVFKWSNDELVRSQSYTSEKIDYEGHCLWFNNKVESKSAAYYIVSHDEQPISLVRFDIGTEYTTVGVMIAKEARGNGFAPKVLKLGAVEYFKENKKTVLAFIKKENIASVKSFKKAGFVQKGEENVKNIPSFVYELIRL